MDKDKDSKFFTCDCFTHSLEITKNIDDGDAYFAFWSRGRTRKPYTFLDRLKWAYEDLFGKDRCNDDLIFQRDTLKKIGEYIDSIVEEMDEHANLADKYICSHALRFTNIKDQAYRNGCDITMNTEHWEHDYLPCPEADGWCPFKDVRETTFACGPKLYITTLYGEYELQKLIDEMPKETKAAVIRYILVEGERKEPVYKILEKE